ncbi:MAG TPA: VOC family protein [Candidatus Polarisedimenticolia bacterium]|nr:VOC family protein [Candidatus Polarisedimenticolia bacterium]
MTTKITPMLWFDTQAEDAAKFYTSIFPNSKIGPVTRYGDNMPMPKGTAMTVTFTLDGQEYTALNGGPHFQFSEAISLVIHCRDQKEIDHYWGKLLAGGSAQQCGWLKDRYGLSWQVVPTALMSILAEGGPAAARAMQAVMQMVKLDLAAIETAAHG